MTTDRIPGEQGKVAEGARGLGADLRARREELGWALPDLAEWLRIRESYLRALEEGNTGIFPGSAYALGFLRSYAQALGMDPDQAVARFRRDTRGALDRKPELTFPEPVSERGVPVGLWVGAGLAVLVGTYIGYYHFAGSDPAPTHQMPPVAEIMPGVTQKGTTSPQIAAVMPERGLAPSPQKAPPAPAPQAVPSSPISGKAPQAASVAETSTSSQPAALSPVTETQNGPIPPASSAPDQISHASSDSSAAQTGTAQPPLPTEATQPPLPSAVQTATPAPTGPAAAVTPANMIVLHAGSDAWVSIKDKAGATVFSRVLKTGETWQGPEDAGPYRMTLGNAGGLTLSSGDVTTSALGRAGAVRRGLIVTAEAIRTGQLGQESSGAPAVPSSATPALPASAPVTTGAASTAQNGTDALKKAPAAPRNRVSTHDNADHESETDRLNARQLEQTAQPR
ncbi:helix-turn-helix domain-containing protein [Asaia astilbis]|uniref:helix-turn-helix domain-containing protein n=1 Tax=Asaia astilbis TaxID=610244 RepID=UPI000470A18F|nr:helix-turn-helix domain-containing protein [Asaia astilbis]